ncbi:MAG: adenosine deaminase [Nannocystales bacterium]
MNGVRVRRALAWAFTGLALVGCQDASGGSSDTDTGGASTEAMTDSLTSGVTEPSSGTTMSSSGTTDDTESADSGSDGTTTGDEACETPLECAAAAEDDAGSTLEEIRGDAAAVEEFLVAMPLGGDLHHHLSGSVYAETYLGWAAADGDFCIAESGLALSLSCGDGNDVPIPSGKRDLYLDVVRAWSMLDFVPSPSESGADHFFSTFSKFGAISGSQHGRMLADVRRRAAAENLLYIEPMLTSNSTARSLGQDVWAGLGGGSVTTADYASFHAALLADSGFPAARARLTDDAENSENIANAEQNCGTADAAPGCAVRTRYQAYISRSGTDSGVFAQMVAAYEAAIVEPRIVGLNLVGPEDGSTAMSNYDDQMDMLGYLGDYYADSSPLRLSLHAGEITAASVPDGYQLDETDHIRKAVEIAGTRRVGHGVDVNFESDADGLFDLLRDRGILVEICFASNDIILEVTGPTHPVHDYLERGVPVALATDDQGVARSSLAAEFVRGVMDQDLSYLELKQMVRASIEYSFLPGDSFWADVSTGTVVDACTPAEGDTPVTESPSAECQSFLEGSERAQLQRLLESQLETFEAGF